jgi:hypothetical protein
MEVSSLDIDDMIKRVDLPVPQKKKKNANGLNTEAIERAGPARDAIISRYSFAHSATEFRSLREIAVGHEAHGIEANSVAGSSNTDTRRTACRKGTGCSDSLLLPPSAARHAATTVQKNNGC